MFVLAALCLLAGILPGFFIDALAPVVQALVGERMPVQVRRLAVDRADRREPQLLQRAAGVLFMRWAGIGLLPIVIHRFASDALRRGPAWDCGFPDASPVTQYTADSFAQPIRRVFGRVVFRAREHVQMPPPGDARAGAPHRAACAI